jgi:hypothetical protein
MGMEMEMGMGIKHHTWTIMENIHNKTILHA